VLLEVRGILIPINSGKNLVERKVDHKDGFQSAFEAPIYIYWVGRRAKSQM
jgi:hypothetical protein